MNFKEKTILITGGASGMGAASAREFASAGAHVFIVDLNGPLARQVAAEIGAPDPIIGDVADSEFCRRAVAEVLNAFGGWMSWSTAPGSSIAPGPRALPTSNGGGSCRSTSTASSTCAGRPSGR